MNYITVPGPIETFGDEHDGVVEFVGLTNDNGAIEVGSYFGDTKPKNIIAISSQVGCPSKCSFCELSQERFGRNLSAQEIAQQVYLMQEHAPMPEKLLKVTISKTGEPMYNKSLVAGLELLTNTANSFKVSTIYPKWKKSEELFDRLMDFSVEYQDPVQLQISLLSTSFEQRRAYTGVPVANFSDIQKLGEKWKSTIPNARDINLSIILCKDTICNVDDIKNILTPDLFRFRFREYVPTTQGKKNLLETINQPKMKDLKASFHDAGYTITDYPTPTPIEWKHLLAANVTRRKWMDSQ